jgi:hypothetical protein
LKIKSSRAVIIPRESFFACFYFGLEMRVILWYNTYNEAQARARNAINNGKAV